MKKKRKKLNALKIPILKTLILTEFCFANSLHILLMRQIIFLEKFTAGKTDLREYKCYQSLWCHCI